MARVDLWGNIGQDPELKYTDAGQPYLRLSVAENKGKRGEGRDDQEPPDWWTVMLWGSMAELYANVLLKGMRVNAVGRLAVKTFTRKDGSVDVDRTVHADALGFTTKRATDVPDAPYTQEPTQGPSTSYGSAPTGYDRGYWQSAQPQAQAYQGGAEDDDPFGDQ